MLFTLASVLKNKTGNATLKNQDKYKMIVFENQ